MLGGSVRYYAAGAVRTRALECGDTHSEPVVLLHGVSGHAETWLKNVVPLGQRWHVYAIDLVGHGFTDKPPDLPYTIDTFVEHILAFLDAVGARSAHFVGQSLGGWVASWLAYRHPQRARSITLVTSA